MKKRLSLIFLAMTAILMPLFGNSLYWESFTNTNHIFDFIYSDNQLSIASWGGMDVFEKSSGSPFSASSFTLDNTVNNVSGLSANDIRSITLDPVSKFLWLSIYNKGINIYGGENIVLIDEEILGLLSNKVNKVLIDDFAYVATDSGLGLYQTYEGLSFPLLTNQYTNELTSGGLISDNIQDAVITESGYLVLATDSGVSYVHRDSLRYQSAWKKWTLSNSNLPSSDVVAVAAKNDHLVLGTRNGLMIVNGFPNSIEFQEVVNFGDISYPAISTVFIDSQEQIWLSFGVWDESKMIYTESENLGIVKLSIQGAILQSWALGSDNLDTVDITSFQEIENVICASTWGEGLIFYENGEWNKLKSNCIGFNSVKTIKTDQQSRLWFASGTYSGDMTKKGTRGVSSFKDEQWETYTVANSALNSDNINTVAVDSHNRKWFGAWSASTNNPYGWQGGVTVLDDTQDPPLWFKLTTGGISRFNNTTEQYEIIDTANGLFGSTVPYISVNDEGNVLVSCFDRGLSIYSPDNSLSEFEKIEDLRISNSPGQKVVFSIQTPDKYFFSLNRTLEESGKLYYWDDSSLPNSENDENLWVVPHISDLESCTINAFETFMDPFGRQQTWIAANTGLFMHISSAGGENGWYRWSTNKKREYWNGSSWVTSMLYYVDEERLFGSVATEALSLFYDPFGILWLGSNGSGFSSFNPYTERFTNYSTGNSPLISDIVTAFGHDPDSGRLYIGTPEGLSSFRIGSTTNEVRKFFTVKAYPNPCYPERGESVIIQNLDDNNVTNFPRNVKECYIYDIAGDLIRILKIDNQGFFIWDCDNEAGKQCSSGVYFYVISSGSGSARGKIAVIR